MNAHERSEHKPRFSRSIRGSIALLIALAGLTVAVSLVSASQDGRWNATDLQLQNADFFPNSVVIDYYKLNGLLGITTTSDTLGGKQSKVYSPTSPISGTVHVETSGHVFGVVTHHDDSGSAQWPLIEDAKLDKTAYVPHFVVQPTGPSSRLTVHNLELTAASISILFYNPSGTVIDTYTTTLPARGAKFLDRAALGLPTTFQASAVVHSDGRIYVGVDRLYDDRTFATAFAPTAGGYQLVAPLFMHVFGGFDSVFSVQNIGPVSTSVVMTYFNGMTGASLSTTTVLLAPNAAFDWVGLTTPAATYGQIVATSQQLLVAVVQHDRTVTPTGRIDYTALVIVPKSPDGLNRRVAYGPVVLADDNGWSSDVFVSNPNSFGIQVKIEYSSTPTGVLTNAVASLPPHGTWLFSTSDLPHEFQRAAMRVSSNQVIAAVVRTGNPQLLSGDALMAYEAFYAPTLTELFVYLPLLIKE